MGRMAGMGCIRDIHPRTDRASRHRHPNLPHSGLGWTRRQPALVVVDDRDGHLFGEIQGCKIKMKLPDTFVNNIRGAFQEKGEIFLTNLPRLIEEAAQLWNLSEVQPVPNLSYNFVAFAKQGEQDVILKIGIPNHELTSEMNALKLFNGEGACQLLDCDEERGFLLIERLEPGTMLADLEDDDERTHIAIDVIQNLILHRGKATSPTQVKFIKLSDWFGGLKDIRPQFNGGTGPIPEKLLDRVEASLPELFADDDYLIHGDFHHYNILLSERGWLVIDPKGVIGPVGYEIGPFMLNPWVRPMDRVQFEVQARRRVDIFHERLGWEREKIIGWSLAHSVLSAYWDLELEPMYSVEAAEIFSRLK